MKTPTNTIFWLLLSMLFSSCNQKTTNVNLDNEIYSQIFQTIVDSCVVLPPPEPNQNVGEKFLKEYKNRFRCSFDKKMLIAIYDTITAYDKTRFEQNVNKNVLNAKWTISDRANLVIKIDDYKVQPNITL